MDSPCFTIKNYLDFIDLVLELLIKLLVASVIIAFVITVWFALTFVIIIQINLDSVIEVAFVVIMAKNSFVVTLVINSFEVTFKSLSYHLFILYSFKFFRLFYVINKIYNNKKIMHHQLNKNIEYQAMKPTYFIPVFLC